MITISIKDAFSNDIEITKVWFQSEQEANAEISNVIGEIASIWGANLAGLYAEIMQDGLRKGA